VLLDLAWRVGRRDPAGRQLTQVLAEVLDTRAPVKG
jgi:hypothetical protein